MRDQFLEYIESRPSSANSGSNYISGINAISERFLKFDLFKIASAQEVQSIILELKNNKDFMQANTKGHNMYLRAIKHYMEFLLEPNKKSILKKSNLTNIQKLIATEMLKIVISGQVRIEYNELSERIKKEYGIIVNPHTELPILIGDISKICHSINLPMISCIVVNKETQLPGIGFYKLYDELNGTKYASNKYFEEKIRNEVKKAILNCGDWYKLSEYLDIEIEGIVTPKENSKTENKTNSVSINNNDLSKFESVFPEEVSEKYQEGTVKSVLVNKYERNPIAKKKCIEYFGTQCQICGFKFSEKYGAIFENKIHVHHIKPIAEIGEEYEIDPIKDLIPVCPNCHMILHSKGKNEVYSIDEVKKMIKNNL